LILDLINGQQNTTQVTSDGGAAAGDWSAVVDTTDGAWFGLEFNFLKNEHARATGPDFCQSTNAGAAWSGRTLDSPWPIREVLFLNKKTGWAAGGNIYSGVGGIYFSGDGGNTWSLDVNTGAEMDACATRPVKPGHQVWCAGYDSAFNGYVYTTNVK
jgi:hypothetical protein